MASTVGDICNIMSSEKASTAVDALNYPGMERWKGRVAIVTGASAGIGYETAKRLAQLGVVVVGCARNIAAIKVSVVLISLVPSPLFFVC